MLFFRNGHNPSCGDVQYVPYAAAGAGHRYWYRCELGLPAVCLRETLREGHHGCREYQQIISIQCIISHEL